MKLTKALTVAIKAMLLTLGVWGAVAVIEAGGPIKSAMPDDGSQLVGNWTGESLCVGDHPACHDEKVVYRISKSAGKSDSVTIIMDKIIEGKPETIGMFDFKYDAVQK